MDLSGGNLQFTSAGCAPDGPSRLGIGKAGSNMGVLGVLQAWVFLKPCNLPWEGKQWSWFGVTVGSSPLLAVPQLCHFHTCKIPFSSYCQDFINAFPLWTNRSPDIYSSS